MGGGEPAGGIEGEGAAVDLEVEVTREFGEGDGADWGVGGWGCRVEKGGGGGGVAGCDADVGFGAEEGAAVGGYGVEGFLLVAVDDLHVSVGEAFVVDVEEAGGLG